LTIAVLLFTARPAAAQRRSSCAEALPAGLVIRATPDERIIAGDTDGPLLLTVTSDVRLFPGKLPIVPRGSKIFARTIESREAGRIKGRARYQMAIDTIMTPSECEYGIDARIVAAGNFKVREETVVGKGHARRDFLLWLFPPTTIYQMIRLPARGPRMVLDEETVLAIRLLQPVILQESRSDDRTETPNVRLNEPRGERYIPSTSTECHETSTGFNRLVQIKDGVIRPFRNKTPYNVAISIGTRRLANLGPCVAAMVTTPTGKFTITATASVPQAGGQRERQLAIVVNDSGTGWDVVDHEAGPDSGSVRAQLLQR
jgi:hypothetical protein